MIQKRAMVWSIRIPEEGRTWNSHHVGTEEECEALERMLEQLAHHAGWIVNNIRWERVIGWEDGVGVRP